MLMTALIDETAVLAALPGHRPGLGGGGMARNRRLGSDADAALSVQNRRVPVVAVPLHRVRNPTNADALVVGMGVNC
jgi:hypothetical protein